MRLYLIPALLAGVAVLGCSDASGPGNASDDDRSEILAALSASGWFDETFGADGATDDLVASAAGFNLGIASAQAADTVPLSQRWGRRFHAPTARAREINVEGDTATAVWSLRFADGEFLLDRTRDGIANPTSKPMDVTTLVSATLVRRADADTAGRRWQVVRVSPARTVPTAEDARTVAITAVSVAVNGTVVGTVTDAGRRHALDGALHDLVVGDEVTVTATVTNTTGHDNVPQTFVFLHLYHMRADARGWVRVPMRAQDDGTWVRSWTVRHDGRQRMFVDAIDSQTFNTDSEDDYRAEVWGVPYRIR
jgi:hypothetical protein